MFLGWEAGYRFFVDDAACLLPRALLSVPLRTRSIVPGAEVLVGKTL